MKLGKTGSWDMRKEGPGEKAEAIITGNNNQWGIKFVENKRIEKA